MPRKLTAIMMADMARFSQLVETAEDDVLSRHATYMSETVGPAIREAGGRIVKTTGDGWLADVPCARNALQAARSIQSDMHDHEHASAANRRIQYRIGLNVGDVVETDDDIMGDAVNIASLLESVAEPGAICMSDAFHQITARHLDTPATDLGSQSVKNITRPIRVWQWSPITAAVQAAKPALAHTQRIGFCHSADGTQIAYGVVGDGPTLFKMPNWLNHLEYDWTSDLWGPIFQDLARDLRVIRFDQRGNGLSAWDDVEISFEGMLDDVNAVASAANVPRGAILGMSQGACIAIDYAVNNPDAVACLILYGGYLRGAMHRGDPEQVRLKNATVEVIRSGWGSPDPAFRNLFTDILLPDASPKQKAGFSELQRVASNAENVARINEMNAGINVVELAKQVRVPTLVLHAEGDRRVSVEEGRLMAAAIPGAEFRLLPGNNHMMVPGTEACGQFLSAIRDFVAQHA